jgi:hypothetical protein
MWRGFEGYWSGQQPLTAEEEALRAWLAVGGTEPPSSRASSQLLAGESQFLAQSIVIE